MDYLKVNENDLSHTRVLNGNTLHVILYINPFAYNLEDGGRNNGLFDTTKIQNGGKDSLLQTQQQVNNGTV